MDQPIEVLRMFSVILYYYYLSYKHFPMQIDPNICDCFAAHLINDFQTKFPEYPLDDPKTQLDSFMLFEEPFKEHCSLKELENPFSHMLEECIRFPKEHYLTITNDYVILSILPVPFDSFDVTHGMLVNFFTPILDQSLYERS